MPGSIGVALTYTNLALGGASPSRGTISLSTAPATGGFADFGFTCGSNTIDPYVSHIVWQQIDNSNSLGFVRVSIAATAPTGYTPASTSPQDVNRAAYAGITVQEVNVVASSFAWLDRAQFEAGPPQTLLPQSAEGYDTGMYYTVEPGIGSLWERSQVRTLAGKWAGHFKATPNDSGNTYQKVSNFASYTQILAANRTYADLLIGPS